MDRLYNSPWFVKAISFFIAVMLFIIVNYDSVSNQPGALPNITNVSSTLDEVPLNVYYNEEEFVITDMVEHVKVNIRGPQNVLTLFQIARPNYDVFIDLRNLEKGTHYVKVQHRNFPNELTVNIVPQTVKVTIDKKRTISMPVEIELINKNEIEDGYTVGIPIVNPVNVEITAAESIINHVALAKGFVDVKDLNKTEEKSVPIKVYDSNGNELNIDVKPETVDVQIPVTSPNKNVPVKINKIGELPDGKSIKSIYTEPKDVTIYGPNAVINQIKFIGGIDIDLPKITESTVLELNVPVPSGVEKVIPSKVKVFIEVDTEEEVEIEDIPIEVIGLSGTMESSFMLPEKGIISLIVKGSPENIQKIRKEDLKVYIDVNKLSIGEHTVKLHVTGPQNVKLTKPYNEIKVILSDVLSAEEEETSIDEEEQTDQTNQTDQNNEG